MRIIFALLLIPLILTACDSIMGKMAVSDVYTFESPINIGAIFMTVENHTGEDDRIIAFKTDAATRVELHTMSMQKNTMRMRQVTDYAIAAGEKHLLKPGGDHVMVYGLKEKFKAGQSYEGIIVFEKAGEIPVIVTVRPRSEMGQTRN